MPSGKKLQVRDSGPCAYWQKANSKRKRTLCLVAKANSKRKRTLCLVAISFGENNINFWKTQILREGAKIIEHFITSRLRVHTACKYKLRWQYPQSYAHLCPHNTPENWKMTNAKNLVLQHLIPTQVWMYSGAQVEKKTSFNYIYTGFVVVTLHLKRATCVILNIVLYYRRKNISFREEHKLIFLTVLG